jgi:parvulin-like peptidyl-prolyl isomerase
MLKILSMFMLIFLFVISCSKKPEKAKLESDTPAYQLAVELSGKVPALNPDSVKVLVTSNDFKIYANEVTSMIQKNYGTRLQQVKGLDESRLKDMYMQNARNLGEKELLMEAADEAGVNVSDTEIDSILDMQYKRAGGEDKYMDFLQKSNLTMDYVKGEISDGIKIQKYLDDKLAPDIEVTDQDIQDYYNQDKTATVRHILLSTQGKSEAEKEEIHKKMEDILKRARAGEDFAKLAEKYSDDPGSAKNGGLIENFSRGQMVPPFEKAAFSVPVGEISDIIETRYGYHILKVVDRKKETKKLSEVRPQIEARLDKDKKNQAYQNLLEQLKQDANFTLNEL